MLACFVDTNYCVQFTFLSLGKEFPNQLYPTEEVYPRYVSGMIDEICLCTHLIRICVAYYGSLSFGI